MKINLCLPTGDEVKTDFALSLSRLLLRGAAAGFSFEFTNVKTSNVAQSREQTAEQALKSDCSHMLWLDSDMVFPDWLLDRLLSHDVDIVAGNYCMRGALSPLPTAVVDIQPDGRCRRTFAAQGDALVEVEGVGFGALLMKRAVLEKLALPRFPITWNALGGYHEGEDVSFCANARKAGYKLYIDPLVSRHLGHVGSYLYTLNATPLPYGKAKAMCWGDS
ncbi:MAG: hypothetical protein WD081_07920 [Gammaproteobacteria bacterium]